jgi:hypothetical protein
MMVLVLAETVILVILSVLVAGLLRGYAAVLNRLHQLDGGDTGSPPPFRTVAGVTPPATHRVETRTEWSPAHDIAGVSLDNEILTARTVGVEHDTIIAFLSSGCEGCAGFWQELAELGRSAVPSGTRLIVVCKSPDEESPSVLKQLCPSGVDLIMSSSAWADYEVPGSPFVLVVDGQSGRVKGEGSGVSFSQIGGLIAQAVADQAHRGAVVKPQADREREADVDRVLLAAGIGPLDRSLYPDEQAGSPQ